MGNTSINGGSSFPSSPSLSLGPGSLAAASLGCRVLATDYRQLPLDLLRRAAEACGVPVPERQVLAPGTHHLPYRCPLGNVHM